MRGGFDWDSEEWPARSFWAYLYLIIAAVFSGGVGVAALLAWIVGVL